MKLVFSYSGELDRGTEMIIWNTRNNLPIINKTHDGNIFYQTSYYLSSKNWTFYNRLVTIIDHFRDFDILVKTWTRQKNVAYESLIFVNCSYHKKLLRNLDSIFKFFDPINKVVFIFTENLYVRHIRVLHSKTKSSFYSIVSSISVNILFE